MQKKRKWCARSWKSCSWVNWFHQEKQLFCDCAACLEHVLPGENGSPYFLKDWKRVPSMSLKAVHCLFCDFVLTGQKLWLGTHLKKSKQQILRSETLSRLYLRCPRNGSIAICSTSGQHLIRSETAVFRSTTLLDNIWDGCQTEMMRSATPMDYFWRDQSTGSSIYRIINLRNVTICKNLGWCLRLCI